MALITIKNFTRKYSTRYVVKDFSLEIANGEFTVLTGMKESGKTTILRAICGLDTVDQGEIYVDGNLVNKLEPKDRNMALINKDTPLDLNASVFENIGKGMKLRKFPKEEIEARTKKAIDLLGLTDYANRLTKNLTPGQKYRVLLARAISREPKIVIIDDILKDVEQGLRRELRNEIVKLNKRLKINFIYATDNAVEALSMADKIAFLEEGVLTQYDTPQNIYNTPKTLPIATFFGNPKINLLQSNFIEEDGKLYATAEGFKIFLNVALPKEVKEKYVDKKRKVTLAFRPEDITCDDNGELTVLVDQCDQYGENFVSIVCSQEAEEPTYLSVCKQLEVQSVVKLAIDKKHLLCYDTESEMLLL